MNKDIFPLIVYPENSGYVNCLTPEIHGTGEPGAAINGQIDSDTFSVKVLANGVWSYKPKNPLTNFAEHVLTITQTAVDGKVSASVNARFKTDTNALINQSVTFPSENQAVNTAAPKISGTGKAGANVEVKINSTIYTTVVNNDGIWQIQIEKPLPEGPVSAEITQKDKGNLSLVKNINFSVDTSAPEEPKIEKPANNSYEKMPTPVVRGKGEPNATIDAVVDDKNYTASVNKSGDWSFEISQALADDIHIIGVKQKDAAGNISAESTNVFTVDTKQPKAPKVIDPSNGAQMSDNRPTIIGYGESGNRIEVRVNNKVYSCLVGENGIWSVKITDTLIDGTNTLKIYQISKAGNVSPCTEVTIKVDTTAPLAPAVIYPEDEGYVNNTSFQVKGTGEPDAQVECTVAGKKYTTKVKSDGSFVLDIKDNENILEGQSYSIIAKQTDIAGNESSSIRVRFRVDKQCLNAPQINSPAADSVINSVTPSFRGKGKPGATIIVNIGNDSFIAQANEDGYFNVSVNKALAQGVNVANIYQCDMGNTSSPSSLRFTIDTVAPTAPKINYPAENAVLQDKNLIIKGSGEPGGNIEILVDDKSYCTSVKDDGNWDFKVPKSLENGTHAALVYQTDKAGNKSQSSYVNFVCSALSNVQTVGKVIDSRIFYNPSGPELVSKAIINLKTNVPVTIDNVCGTNFSKVVCENGIYNFDYIDAEGKHRKAAAAVTWIDNKPPVIDVKPSGNYFSSDKTVSYSKPTGSAICHALLNDTPFESGKKITEEGCYKVVATDQAGNTASESFIIDKTPPSISGVEDKKVYPCDVCINFCDNMTGIKSAKLNGENIAPETILTKNGDYTLTVSDYGDNKTEISFKIQK